MTAAVLTRPSAGTAAVPVPFGTVLRRLRLRRGLSQAACAGLIGRSESWLSQVERGERTMDRISVLRDLAVILDVEVITLLEAVAA